MRYWKSTILALTLSATALVGGEGPGRAQTADGCLPTNGLMNLNPADSLMAGTVHLPTVTVQIGTGDVNWAHTQLDTGSARWLYSLKWAESLVRETRNTGDPKYLARAVEIAVDFAADNPVDAGPDPADAWDPMYGGQRATAIACIANVTDDARIDASLRTHAEWLTTEVDDLPAWNQAIDPHLGLLMAGCRFDVGAWRQQAEGGFVRLIETMIDPDGVLNEQAPGYGQFVWARWGLVSDQLAACGLQPPATITQRRSALIEWLGWMSAPSGSITPIGDSFQTIPPPTPSGSLTEYMSTGGAEGSHPEQEFRVFDGGYVVGRNTWTDPVNSTYWTLRFGAGRDLHGHEDHTSVTFWAEGREVLIDSGHGGYADQEYREALRGPEAHNILVLPDIRMQRQKSTELLRSEAEDGWTFAEVRGNVFGRQDGRFVYAPRTRGVLVLPDDGIMVVQDQASRVTHGPFEQLWHLVPDAQVVSTTPTGIVARHPSGDVDIHLVQVPLPGQVVPADSTSTVAGQLDPLLGWWSEANGHREPAPVVRMRRNGTELRMITVITTTPVGQSISGSATDHALGWTIDLDTPAGARTIGVSFDGNMTIGEPLPGVLPMQPARRCSMSVNGC